MKPELSNHAEAVSRFNTEARACFVLRSEHVVRVLDVDSHAGSPFIVMELLDGTDLRRVLETGEALDPALVVDYALQVCEGLCAAHASGIVHRDIKPENLFLHGTGPDACIKLLDFGISQVEAAYEHDPLLGHTDAVAAAGTPPYMSPEQLSGAAVDARSDVWSLGCVLYELLTGTAPFERGTWQESCAAVLSLQPPAAHTLRPELDPGLSELVARCLHKDPAQRYSDAAQLAAALAAFGSGQFADYPARCYAQLTGERCSTPDLAAVRGAPAADSGTAFDWSTLRSSPDARTVIQALFQLMQRALPSRQGVLSVRNVWLAVAILAVLCMLTWADEERSEDLHIVTPSAAAPEAIQPRPIEIESAALIHSDPLPTAALEQGQSEPPRVVEERTTKRRGRHSGRHSRYQRRHAQREPDVGF